MQELGLSSFSSESRDAASKASSEGQQYHTLFNIFYKLVYEHIASLVEVSPQPCCVPLFRTRVGLILVSYEDIGSASLPVSSGVQGLGTCVWLVPWRVEAVCSGVRNAEV